MSNMKNRIEKLEATTTDKPTAYVMHVPDDGRPWEERAADAKAKADALGWPAVLIVPAAVVDIEKWERETEQEQAELIAMERARHASRYPEK